MMRSKALLIQLQLLAGEMRMFSVCLYIAEHSPVSSFHFRAIAVLIHDPHHDVCRRRG